MPDKQVHPKDLPPTQDSLDRAAQSAVMANEIWIDLKYDVKRDFCDMLAAYSGPNVFGRFIMLSEWAARKKLAIANNPQTTATGKRKRDDSEVTEPPRAPEKKPKVAQVTAPPLRSANIDIVSPKIPVAWPAFRQSPIIFGQPKLSSIIAGRSSTVRPPSIAATSTPAPNLPSTVSALLSGPQRASFAKFASDQPKRRVQEEPACDEHFTFADRRRSHPQPTSRSGAAHQHSKTAQNTSSNQPPPISSVKSQAADGWQPISTIYKPPFAGVDMSSLRIPANSNVTMNFFHAPSVLHQNAESDGPRKLKCIQCKEVYMEARNTAMECRRHTGRCVNVDKKNFDHHDIPVGASQVWDCCRRTVQSLGCFPCNHYAG